MIFIFEIGCWIRWEWRYLYNRNNALDIAKICARCVLRRILHTSNSSENKWVKYHGSQYFSLVMISCHKNNSDLLESFLICEAKSRPSLGLNGFAVQNQDAIQTFLFWKILTNFLFIAVYWQPSKMKALYS